MTSSIDPSSSLAPLACVAGRFGAPPKIAVKGVTFGVPEGQCFGFLGINVSLIAASISPVWNALSLGSCLS